MKKRVVVLDAAKALSVWFDNDEALADAFGSHVGSVLRLNFDRKGRTTTLSGSKTRRGVGRVVMRLLLESVEAHFVEVTKSGEPSNLVAN